MGGTSGIGWAAAKKFVEEGAHVICVGKPQETAIEGENITTLFGAARDPGMNASTPETSTK